MPYWKYVEDRITNPVYISLLSAWQLATFELSDVSELSFKQVGYYETILFDILYTENKNESNLENIDKLVKSTHATAIKDVYELYGDCLTQDLSELQKDSEKYNNILSTFSDLVIK